MKGATNSYIMGSTTPTPSAEKTGIVHLSRSEKGGTNGSVMGSLTPTPTAEKRAAFALIVVSKAPPTVVKWAA